MPKWTNEQLEAIVKDGSNIIVSAGAGSGKTAVLSERVIHKLENGIHIDELLILTFTKAAAEEMKDRIRKKINKRSDLKEEADRLDSAYITTFDSYALSIVKKYHYLLNIDNNIAITDESIINIIKNKIFNELFEEKYEKEDNQFLDFIKNNSLKSDIEIKENIISIANKMEGIIDRDKLFKYIKDEFWKDDNLSEILKDYLILVDDKKREIRKKTNELELYVDNKTMENIAEVVNNVLNNFDVEKNVILTNTKLPPLKKGADDETKKKKAELKKLLDELNDFAIFGDLNNIKNNISETKNDVLVIMDIIEEYLNKLEKYKREKNIYSFNDIAFLAIRIFKDFEFARNEIKNSYKEIMIDEYQDTNDIQEIFMSYIENNNVYMVGDIKQSIYKFRGSNPFIFKNKYDKYSKNDGGIKIDLLKNFRSRDEVLNNINKIFTLIMDDKLGGAEYITSHQMIYGNNAYDEKKEKIDYNLEILEYDNDTIIFNDEEIEIFTICTDIKNKIKSKIKVFDKNTNELRDINYSDFVIILDRSKYFDKYRKIFEYLGVPLDVLHDGSLTANDDLLIIKNIVDLILCINENKYDEKFRFCFVSIARSFLYEYDDDKIFNAIKNNDYKNTTIYKDFSEVGNISSMTANELFMKILDITNFTDKLYKIGDYDNTNVRLESIYNLSNNIADLGMSIEDFGYYLDKIIEEKHEIKYTEWNKPRDAVKILTIHKSKGLEYPICYFADMGHEFNNMEFKNKFILDDKYGIIESSFDTNKNILKFLYKRNAIKDVIDEKIRLLYVALTRAREKMIIVIPNKDVDKYEKSENGSISIQNRLTVKSLADLINITKPYLDTYFSQINLGEINLTKNYLYNGSKKTNFDVQENNQFEVNEICIENDITTKEHFSKNNKRIISRQNAGIISYGNRIHEILEFVDFKNYKNQDLPSNINKIVESFLTQIGNIENTIIYHEYEFYYNESNKEYHGIIDLLIEYDDEIKIVDYKLKNISDVEYKKQLEGYKKYIKTKTNKRVNTYLYSIIDNELKKI